MSARAPTGPRWAYLAEAEEYSGLSARTLRRWISAGRLPGSYLGKKIQVDLNDLDDLRKPVPAGRISPRMGEADGASLAQTG